MTIENFLKNSSHLNTFSPEKNDTMVLFKPSVPVQVRELNEMQSIMNNQRKLFADHMFKDGSRIRGQSPFKQITKYVSFPYLQMPGFIADAHFESQQSQRQYQLKCKSKKVEASVILFIREMGSEFTGTPSQIFLNYTGGDVEFSVGDTVTVFRNGEEIDEFVIPTDTTKGNGVLWKVPEGTYYVSGYFVEMEDSFVVGERFTEDQEDYVIGFDIFPDYVTQSQDKSLLDNSSGSPNFGAPGADRSRVRVIPTRRSPSIVDGETFVTLVEVRRGEILSIKDRTEYADLMNMLEERTYDESGDYTVTPFIARIEPLDDDNFNVVLSSGLAYIRGRRVEKITETTVACPYNKASLPRIDTLVMNRDGGVIHFSGIPSLEAKVPRGDSSRVGMTIYQLHQKANSETTSDVRTKIIDNRRYTMRDIGRVEKKIENLEYYTTFTVMERELAQMSVKDDMGLERYKNGFLTDDFSNFQGADLNNAEFKASLDRTDKTLRPLFDRIHCDVRLSEVNSKNYKTHGPVVTLDYNEEAFITQSLASKTISVNPYFVFNQKGILVLDPAFDNTSDVNSQEFVTHDILMPELVTRETLGKDFGDWKSVSVSTTELENRVTGATLKTYMRSIPVKFFASGMKPNTRVYALFDGIDVTSHCRPSGTGTRYGDQLVISENGTLSGEFLIPANTFFTGQKEFLLSNTGGKVQDVDEVITSSKAVYWSGGLDLAMMKETLNLITPIKKPPPPPPVTNPPPATNAPIIIMPPAAPAPPPARQPPTIIPPPAAPVPVPITPAPTSSINTSVVVVITPAAPRITQPPTTRPPAPTTQAPTTQAPTTQAPPPTTTPAPTTPAPPPPPPPPPPTTTPPCGENGHWDPISEVCQCRWGGLFPPDRMFACIERDQNDPIAQSFFIEHDCFITSIDIYFSAAPAGERVFFNLVEMENGYPTTNILSSIEHDCSMFVASEDSSIPSNIRFPFPVQVEGGKEYAIVIGGYSISPRVWISKLGSEDKITGATIETQPTLGSLFKSQNSSTWDASQYEDLKFTLYRARFKHREGKFSLTNKPFMDEKRKLNPLETESGSRKVRVHYPSHGMSVGELFTPRLGENTWIEVKPSGVISIGQEMVTETGKGIIRDVRTSMIDGNTKTEVQLKHMIGHFESNQKYQLNTVTEDVDNHLLRSYVMVEFEPPEDLKSSGTVVSGMDLSLNGIHIGTWNKPQVVTAIDGPDSFIMELQTPANLTGQTGGDVVISGNNRYDMINFSGDYKFKNCTEKWEFRGTGYHSGGIFSSDDRRLLEPFAFETGEDTPLTQPYKVLAPENDPERVGSFLATGTFYTASDLDSPILNLNTFALRGLANRVDSFSEQSYNTEPNAVRFIPETDPDSGIALYKYVTKMVALSNPASDLRLYIDVHKPKYSDFQLFIKYQEPWDFTDIDEIPWIPIENDSTEVITRVWRDFTCDEGEYREVSVQLSKILPATFGEQEKKLFSKFKLKIVGRTSNPAQPPLFRALRVIAVT